MAKMAKKQGKKRCKGLKMLKLYGIFIVKGKLKDVK